MTSEESGQTMTVDEAREFIAACEWTTAKRMPEIPHSYIARQKVDQEKFEAFVRLIRSAGERRRWRKYYNTYLDIDGWQYWTMGWPVPATIIVNRSELGDPRTDATPVRVRKIRLPR